jgi:hypothetical protein
MTTTVSKGQASAVFTTKKGLYEFLVVEMEYYLPPCSIATMDFLRDIATSKKKVGRREAPRLIKIYRCSRPRL